MPVITDEEGDGPGVGPAAGRDRPVRCRPGPSSWSPTAPAPPSSAAAPRSPWCCCPRRSTRRCRRCRRWPGSVGSDAFASAISQVATAAGRDDTLPALTGIRIEIDGDTLTLVATDRYRLAVRELRWNPARPGPVHGRARAGPGARRHRARADPGPRWPSRWRAARAARHVASGRRPADHHQAAVRRVSQVRVPAAQRVQRDGGAGGRLVRRGGEARGAGRRAQHPGAAGVQRRASWCSRPGVGDEAQATEIVEAGFEGEDLQIAFNPQYLLDGIGAIGSDTARISFTSPAKPAVITGKTEREHRLPLRAHADPQRGIGRPQAVGSRCALDSAGADGLPVLCRRQY